MKRLMAAFTVMLALVGFTAFGAPVPDDGAVILSCPGTPDFPCRD